MHIDLVSPLSGWCLALKEVPDPVFADELMGPGIAIDPTGDVLHAPCSATVLTVHSSGHAVTLRTDEGLELLLHIGVDTVQLAGKGFEPLVEPGQKVTACEPLIRFDLDLLVRHAPAMVSPIIVTAGAAAVTPLMIGRLVSVGEPVMQVECGGVAPEQHRTAGDTIERKVVVGLAHGLHARPAARIAAALRGLDADVALVDGGKRASATSSVAMLGLGLKHGDTVSIVASGPDANAAVDAVAPLLRNDTAQSDEPPTPPPPPVTTEPTPAGALKGIAAAPGLATGIAHHLAGARLQLPEKGTEPQSERARLERGIAAAGQALSSLNPTGPAASILAAHRELLADPVLRSAAEQSIANGAHAATAFVRAAEALAGDLRRTGDRRTTERADDIMDVANRVARAILGIDQTRPELPQQAILIADNLLPSQLIGLSHASVAGIALAGGGPTSHVAIIAAGMGVPMVVALGDALSDVADGARVIIDGDQALLFPAADALMLADTDERISRAAAAEAAVTSDATHSVDGTRVAVFANLGSLDDASTAAAEGAEGCGLLRTELLFLDRPVPPSQDEQAGFYGDIASRLPKPLVIRLLDVGGDKPASYLALPAEENPALGERGIRVLLTRPELLDAQLRGIMAIAKGRDVRIMVPMLTSMAELTAVREALLNVAGGDPIPPLGVMVETPAAALIAHKLAEVADFLSIGSNDLTQYALAVDRGNPAVSAAADGLHPAVLRLIDLTCRGAATRSCPVSLCGGLAADALAVPLLLGLGVRTLSVPPKRVRAIKLAVATTHIGKAEALAKKALDASSADEVRALARRFREQGA